MSLVVTLLVTCFISWYVAYGNAALAEMATAREVFTKAQDRVDEAETGVPASPAADADDQAPAPNAAPAPGQTPVAAPALPAPADQFTGFCARKPYQSASQSQLCDARDNAQAAVNQVKRRLADWLCWDWISNCSNPAKVEDAPSRAAALASIIGSAVLPFLYGLLGAGAAIIRSLSRKIRASLLSPRDLHLSFQQLALGAVVGACIGLFVSAPGSDGNDSILGPVTLSASAISFVAGFGVEAVFQALEALITRIFNLTSTAPPSNRADGAANS
jgi:hypothetical protein